MQGSPIREAVTALCVSLAVWVATAPFNHASAGSILFNAPTAHSRGVQQLDPPVEVRIVPSSAEIATNEEIDVAVEVVDVPALYGFDVSIAFDPDTVVVVDADPNEDGVQVAFGTFLDPGFVVENSADTVAGRIRFAMTQLNPSKSKSGTGVLIVVRIRARQARGATPITIIDAQLAQRDGKALETTFVSGEVVVTAPGTPRPTNTSIPTQNPRALVTPTPTVSPAQPEPSPSPQLPTATASPTKSRTPSQATAMAGTATSPSSATPVNETSTQPTDPRPTRASAPESAPSPTPSGASPTTRAQPSLAAETPVASVARTATGLAADPSASQRATTGPAGRRSWLLWLAVGLLASAGALFALAIHVKRR